VTTMREIISLLLAFGLFAPGCWSYPMIIEIPEESEKCIHFSIPDDDDAHMAFFALGSPASESTEVDWTAKARRLEDYFVEQMDSLTRVRSEEGMNIPSKFPQANPEEIQKIIDEFLMDYGENSKTDCHISLTNPDTGIYISEEAKLFKLMVINHARKSVRKDLKKWEDVPLEGYMLCFTNDNKDEELFVLMETVLVNEEKEDPKNDKKSKKKDFKKEHLTPLAEELADSLEAAETILHEMKYMEKREARMRITTEKVNRRVRYLSYNSIAVLLFVTYVQVTYLKRYFRKKKLL